MTNEEAPMFRSVDQTNFYALVARHMAQPDAPLLLEGSTGLGKTRALLAAVMQAAANGQLITIALPSHQLIDQWLASSDLAATRRPGVAVVAFRPVRWFGERADYVAQRDAAMAAPVQLCTSAAVIIDRRLGGAYNGASERDYLLFDEADQLPDAAALQSDREISAATLQGLGVARGTGAQEATKALAAVLQHAGAEPETRAAALLMQDALNEPAWYHRVGWTDEGGLMLYHQMPGRLLQRIANRPGVAFVSATLTVGGQMDDFKRALGIAQQSALSGAVEPERHGALDFVVTEAEVDTPEWLTRTAATIEAAQLGGPVLVATPSHTLAQQLGGLLPWATVRRADETTGEAAARMGSSRVLIAAGAWAGLDTPVVWKSIVVPRVPFERPVVLDGQVESRYVDTRNTAIRRMRQVIGRGLRSPDASCTVHILDNRYTRIEAFVPPRFRAQWAQRQRFAEGARAEVTLSLIERAPAVRKAALAHHGKHCMGCGFVPKVDSQLDVHHLNPLGTGGERLTDLDDVAVLCANCHRLAHSESPPLALAALRTLVLT
jgi:Rad3-related DNA helicase